jgi:hypothetical protein
MNLETDDPEKGQLLQKSAHHQKLLEEEVKLISERSEKIITNALIIGGALALTYFLVSGLSRSSEKKKSRVKKVKLVATPDESDSGTEELDQPAEAGLISTIGSVLVAQATGFLLSIAREKLVEYLQSQGVKKGNGNERP